MTRINYLGPYLFVIIRFIRFIRGNSSKLKEVLQHTHTIVKYIVEFGGRDYVYKFTRGFLYNHGYHCYFVCDTSSCNNKLTGFSSLANADKFIVSFI